MTETIEQIPHHDLMKEIAQKHDVALKLFPDDWVDEKPFIQTCAEELSDLWDKKPFDNNNGISSQGSLCVYYYTKKLAAENIIEVGSWRGFSTWVMEQAMPNSQFVCLDPVFTLEHLMNKAAYLPTYRPKKSVCMGQDFSTFNLQMDAKTQNDTFVFFDDHQNKVPRLLQAKQRGLKRMLFDDNPPFKYTHMSFPQYLNTKENIEALFKMIKRYEIFPPVHTGPHPKRENIHLKGLDLPKTKKFDYLKDSAYSWITYVELK